VDNLYRVKIRDRLGGTVQSEARVEEGWSGPTGRLHAGRQRQWLGRE
jgi:hypothetical protein